MKRYFFIAATAALALSSCSSEEIVTPQPVEDGAVVFSANTLRDTRAASPIANVDALAAAKGFGVFGYEHGDKEYATFSASSSAPNFFYNQQVYEKGAKEDGSGSVTSPTPIWEYSPIKYYSNNKGAKHSFFAYAPFQEDVNNVFALGSAPAIRYSSKENYDLMWAAPYKNLEKPGVNYKLLFNFQHALSKVDIKVAPFADKVHESTTHDISDQLKDGTTIIVRSVKFVGVVASEGLLSLEDGKWKYIATEESAYEINQPVPLDKSTTAYKDVTKDMMVIPTSVGEGVKIQVVYDVITEDKTNNVNNSIVTNTITSKDIYKLEAGKAYTFNLDLGMTSVKFNATVTDWEKTTPADTNVDLPNNTYADPVALTDALKDVTTITKITLSDTHNATDYKIVNGKLLKWGSSAEDTPSGHAENGYFNVGQTVYHITGSDGTIEATYEDVVAYGTGTTFYVYGTDRYANASATAVMSVIPDEKGKIYDTSGTAIGVNDGDYLTCDGKLYKWKGTAIPAPTPSNRR